MKFLSKLRLTRLHIPFGVGLLAIVAGPAQGQAPAPVVPFYAPRVPVVQQPAAGSGAQQEIPSATGPVVQSINTGDCGPNCATPAPALPPYAGPCNERAYLTGDWWGARSCLRDCGLTFEIFSTQFGGAVTRGGLAHQAEYGGKGDYFLHLNGEKAGLWKGLFVDLHGDTIYGKSVNSLTGAIFPVSVSQTVPTPDGSTTALTGVKVTQALSENFITFAGKINTADGFNQPFAGAANGSNGFMNLNMLFSPAYARVVPYSTLGGGFAVLSQGELVASFMVLDPNNTPTVSGFSTLFDRGVALVGNVNIPTEFFGLKGHQGVLGAYSNSKYVALDGLPYFLTAQFLGLNPALPQETGSWSATYMFDQTIGTVGCDASRPWGIFGNASIADGDANPVRWFVNAGVGGASWLPSRPLDTFGFGAFYVGMSDKYKNLAPNLLPLRDERGLESFYNIAVTPWCHLTSDFQMIVPTRSNVTTAYATSLRLRIDF